MLKIRESSVSIRDTIWKNFDQASSHTIISWEKYKMQFENEERSPRKSTF